MIVNLSGEKCQFDLPNKLLGRKWQQLLGNQDFYGEETDAVSTLSGGRLPITDLFYNECKRLTF